MTPEAELVALKARVREVLADHDIGPNRPCRMSTKLCKVCTLIHGCAPPTPPDPWEVIDAICRCVTMGEFERAQRRASELHKAHREEKA